MNIESGNIESEKFVIVPRRDLDKIEEVRVSLFEIFKEECKDTSFFISLHLVTSWMWHISTNNYPVIDEKDFPSLIPPSKV